MFDVAFNIENLLSASVKDKLSEYDDCVAKAQLLIALVEYDITTLNGLLFGKAEIDEIEAYYEDKTGVSYQPEYGLTEDEKDFILEYAVKINNYGKVKALINDIFAEKEDGENEGDAITAAKRELDETEKREAEEEREKRDRIVDGELDVKVANSDETENTQDTQETDEQKRIYASTILSRAKRAAQLLANRK